MVRVDILRKHGIFQCIEVLHVDYATKLYRVPFKLL